MEEKKVTKTLRLYNEVKEISGLELHKGMILISEVTKPTSNNVTEGGVIIPDSASGIYFEVIKAGSEFAHLQGKYVLVYMATPAAEFTIKDETYLVISGGAVCLYTDKSNLNFSGLYTEAKLLIPSASKLILPS